MYRNQWKQPHGLPCFCIPNKQKPLVSVGFYRLEGWYKRLARAIWRLGNWMHMWLSCKVIFWFRLSWLCKPKNFSDGILLLGVSRIATSSLPPRTIQPTDSFRGNLKASFKQSLQLFDALRDAPNLQIPFGNLLCNQHTLHVKTALQDDGWYVRLITSQPPDCLGGRRWFYVFRIQKQTGKIAFGNCFY